jgi:hypothetical protein
MMKINLLDENEFTVLYLIDHHTKALGTESIDSVKFLYMSSGLSEVEDMGTSLRNLEARDLIEGASGPSLSLTDEGERALEAYNVLISLGHIKYKE